MFIVNDRVNICEEFPSITMGLRENESVMQKIMKKQEELEDNLHLTHFSAYSSRIQELLHKYITENKLELELSVIYINDKKFGIYRKSFGEAIFEEIINALKRGEILFDLRKYEDIKEQNNE